MKIKKIKGVFIKGLVVLALAVGLSAIGLGANSKLASAACSVTPANGQDQLKTFTVSSSGTYYLWVSMLTSSSSSNAIDAQLNGGSCIQVGGSSSIPTNNWTWVGYQNGSVTSGPSIPLTLSSGTNYQITLTGDSTSPNMGIDQILLLSTTCIPTTDGSNCTNPPTPPTVNITSPTSGQTVSGTWNITANASDQLGIKNVAYSIDGNPIGTSSTAPYSLSWNSNSVSNGSHTLTAVATDTSGLTASATPVAFTVNNVVACSGIPTTPTHLSASANGLFGMNLSWTASAPATGCHLSIYNVYRGSASNPVAVVNAPTTTFVDSGLTPSTNYTYYVTAVDASGHTSSPSSTVTGQTDEDVTPPTPPMPVNDTAPTSAAVNLTWGASTDNVAVGGYRVYRVGTSGSQKLIASPGASTLSYSDTTVTPGATYTYAVSAVDTSGNESSQTQANPSPITVPQPSHTSSPTAPTNLKAPVVTTDTVGLTWTASRDNNGATINDYEIYQHGKQVGTSTTPSYTAINLNQTTTYQFYVTASDTYGNTSPQSSTISVLTLTGQTCTSSGDINGDGTINYLDLSILMAHWGDTGNCLPSDLNGDGVVNYTDLNILLKNWSAGLTFASNPNKTYNAVYLKPNKISTAAGDYFSIDLWEYSNTWDANAVEANISWNPKVLRLAYDYFNDSKFEVHAENSHAPNSVEIVRATSHTDYTYDQYIGTLVFYARSTGPANLDINGNGTGLARTSSGTDSDPTPYGAAVSVAAVPNSSTSANDKALSVIPTNTNVTTTHTIPAAPPNPLNASSNSLNVTPNGSSAAVTVPNNSPVQLSSSATIAPTPLSTGAYKSISYYLGSTLLTRSGQPTTGYRFVTANYRNGTYTLTAKEINSDGLVRYIHSQLIVKNAASAKQLYLQAKQYIWLLVAIVIVLVVGGLGQRMFTKKGPNNWSQPIVDPDVRSKVKTDKK